MNKKIFILIFLGIFLIGLPLISSAEGDYSGFNFPTAPCNEPTGITTNNTFIWVVDYDSNIFCEYYMNGTFIKQSAFTGVNANAYSVANNNTFLFVLDLSDKTVYRYYMNMTYIDSFAVSGTPSSITYYNNNLYIGHGDNKVYKYFMNGTRICVHTIALNNDGSEKQYGLALNGTYLWRTGQYLNLSKFYDNGTFIENFDLSGEVTFDFGLTFNDSHFFVVDYTGDHVYAYDFDYVGGGSPVSSSNLNLTQTGDNSSLTFPRINDYVNHTTYAQTNATLSTYIFSTNQSTSWVNDSAVSLSGSTSWINVINQITAVKGTDIFWRIFINNTEGFWNSTSLFNYVVKNTATLITGADFNDTSIPINDTVYLNVTLSDVDGNSDISSAIVTLSTPELVIGNVNTTALDMDYYTGSILPAESYSVYCSETSSLFDESAGVIDMWYRAFPPFRVVYQNSTNGINFTAPVNITINGSFSPLGLEYVIGPMNYTGYPDNTYFMFAPDYPHTSTESDQDIIVINSTNKINWSYACPNEITTGGYKKNPAVYYNESNSLWEALFEQGHASFTTYYWNSTDLCSGWTKYSQQFGGNAGNPDIHFVNDKFIVFYGDMTHGASPLNSSVTMGTNLNDLSAFGKYVLNYYDAGDWTVNFASDPDVVIIPSEYQDTFYAKWFAYFIGVDYPVIKAGVSWDSANRTFEETFFGTMRATSNITLSQEGTSNYWGVEYGLNDETNNTGYYNVTNVYTNDTDNTWFSSLTYTPWFLVGSPDTTPPTFTTIPSNFSDEYGVTISADFDATDETSFSMFFINDTRFTMTNSTGVLTNSSPLGVGNYAVNVTINDSSNNINWTIFTAEITQNTGDCGISFNETSPHSNSTAFSVSTTCTSDFYIMRNGTQIGTTTPIQQYPLNADAYNYSVFRNDTANYSNIFAESQMILTQEIKSVDIEFIYPKANINVTRYDFFNVTFNVTCLSGTCGEVNVSLESNSTIELFNYQSNYSLDKQASPQDIEFDGTYWYVLDDTNNSASKYFTNFTFIEDYDLSSEDEFMVSLYNNATHWTVIGNNLGAFVYIYNSTFGYTGTSYNLTDIGAGMVESESMGFYFYNDKWYVITASNIVYEHFFNWTYTGNSWDVSSEVTLGKDVYFDGTYFYLNDLLDNKVHIYFNNWTYTGDYYDFGTDKIGAGEGAGFGFDDVSIWAYLNNVDEKVFLYSTNFMGSSLISTTPGTTPFYTSNETNPLTTSSLSEGQSELITFLVNATGTADTTYTFFGFANLTSDLSINNQTDSWNVTIVDETSSPPAEEETPGGGGGAPPTEEEETEENVTVQTQEEDTVVLDKSVVDEITDTPSPNKPNEENKLIKWLIAIISAIVVLFFFTLIIVQLMINNKRK